MLHYVVCEHHWVSTEGYIFFNFAGLRLDMHVFFFLPLHERREKESESERKNTADLTRLITRRKIDIT